MAKLQEIVNYLDNYLQTADFKDGSFNGLQFHGKDDVQKVMFAVDSGVKTFEKAVEEGADLVVVHHGLFWQGSNPAVEGIMKDRLKILFENNISLYAAHLPLDKHRQSGNNAQILKLLGAEITEEFVEMDGNNIGYIGKTETTPEEVKQIMEENLNTTIRLFSLGPGKVKRIGVCSGGGGMKAFKEAQEKNVDLYITGEETDFYNDALDAGINLIFAGHHATEIFGVKALSGVVKENFDVETKFVDLPTGL